MFPVRDWIERHADAAGTVASSFSGLCCAGNPALLALLSTIGAGFLITDVFLLPLLAVALVVAFWGLARGRELHGQVWPQRLGWAGGSVLVVGVFAGGWVPFAAVALLVSATGWNILARRACQRAGSARQRLGPPA